MTAIGFVIFVTAWILIYLSEDDFNCSFKHVCYLMSVIIGYVLLMSGIAQWLWKVMP